MEQTNQVQQKKRVVKKKVTQPTPVETTQNQTTSTSPEPTSAPVSQDTEAVTITALEDDSNHDSKFFIPSSRIRNYISGNKLNNVVDSKIFKLKNGDSLDSVLSEADIMWIDETLSKYKESNEDILKLIENVKSGGDLQVLLDVELQKKVGIEIKNLTASNEKSETKIEIVPSDIAVSILTKKLVTKESLALDVLSSQRAKFSKRSFEVLSAFSDMIVEEIAQSSMKTLLTAKRTTLTTDYVFKTEELKSQPLYPLYSKLQTFINMSPSSTVEVTENVETAETAEPTEVAEVTEVTEANESKKLNFKFYVKGIFNDIKTRNAEFSNLKISDKFQTFCSDLILDLLNKVSPMVQILLKVMNTKTITDKVFLTVLELQLFEYSQSSSVIEHLQKKL